MFISDRDTHIIYKGTLMKNLKKGTYEAKLMAVSVIAVPLQPPLKSMTIQSQIKNE